MWVPQDDVALGAGGDYPFGLAIAPDGRKLVYPATKNGVASLWLHDLSNGETRVLAGTEGGAMPFWSANGSRVGFFGAGRLRSIDPGNGQASDLAEASSGRGAAWSGDDQIVFAPTAGSGLMRRASD
ncbi:MAG TPA: hypothetical protein VEA16_04170, partial [Vicinamibacterales bacterium]|nr:hypothetical protein [Vicinamibacterales bacterium]